jgi:hypothetical protein
MNFPSRHPLNQTERTGVVLGSANVVLGLEVTDFWAASTRFAISRCVPRGR